MKFVCYENIFFFHQMNDSDNFCFIKFIKSKSFYCFVMFRIFSLKIYLGVLKKTISIDVLLIFC